MLHVVNGDATLRLIAQAGLDGQFVVWRDALMEGPAPNALRSGEDWEERAARNASEWGISRDAYLAGVRAFFARVDKGDAEEVVLWFEEDLFCQLPLCHLLSRQPPEMGEVSVVCPERQLGLHAAHEVAVLFAARRRPTPGRVDLATRAWNAYGASDPSGLAALVEGDFSAWPLLRRGLLAHLARFPSTRNGLSQLEEDALLALRERPLPFRSLLARVSPMPSFRAVGAGDAQLASWIASLASCPTPLVALAGAAARDDVMERVTNATVALTPAGEAVLADRQDHVALNPPDRWVGGVHLAPGRPLWRWDREAQALRRTDP